MTEPRKLRVFLCHASQDKPVVRELYQRLLEKGWIDPWLDEVKLLPGEDWDLEIRKAVEVSDVVIVCLSNKSVNKQGYIQKEIKKSLDVSDEKPEGLIYIIPVLLDNCEVPKRLKRWQWLDFSVTNKEESFQRLVASLTARAKNLDISFFPEFALSLTQSVFQEYSELRNHIEAAFFYEACKLLTEEDKGQLKMLVHDAWKKVNRVPFEVPHDEHRKLHLLDFSKLQNTLVTNILIGFWDAYEAAGLNSYAGSIDYLEEVWNYHQRMVEAICEGRIEIGYEMFVRHTDLLYFRLGTT